MAATQRFASLAKKFGGPYAATLWSDPKSDPDFSKAIKQNRVVTIVSENVGSRKDYGKIGYHPGANASFLIFPKTLPKDDDSRIVGIQYDVLAPEPVRGRAIKPAKVVRPAANLPKNLVALPPKLEIFRGSKKPSPSRQAHREKAEYRFSALLRRTAVWEQSLTASARTKQEAKKKFQQATKDAVFDPMAAKVETEIKSIRRN
jgi:hypothetical protein